MMTTTANPAVGDGLPNTKRRRGRKPAKAQINAFMGKVLDPLADAELVDKELKRLEDSARRAAWREQRQQWYTAWMECRMLQHRFEALECQRLANLIGSYPEAMCKKALVEAGNALGDGVDRWMRMPAMNRGQLKDKRAFQYVGVRVYRTEDKNRSPEECVATLIEIFSGTWVDKRKLREEERKKFRAEAIAADEARLAGMASA